MTFSEQIDHDLKEAMKAKQADRLSVLRLLKSALKNTALEKGGRMPSWTTPSRRPWSANR